MKRIFSEEFEKDVHLITDRTIFLLKTNEVVKIDESSENKQIQIF